uniref:Coiled-coil domain containing 88Aa n=1 Tax=Dicentrarchus labrax TaxID=13489 RepID=A0A8C4NYJ0_DICLA
MNLLVDARAARTYRDELDALRERAIKADKLESEVGRYREQLHKIEFYKAKVEELKEDNRVLQETKEVLEDQLAGWRARSDKIHQLEKQSLLLKARVHDMEQEREADRRRIEELQEENLALCLAQRRSMEESQHLGWELEQLSKTTENSQGQQSLSEEVSERTCSRMLKLEKENQSLLRTIEDLRAASMNNSTQPKHSHHLECDHVCQLVCSTNNCTSSTDEQTQEMLHGDSNCHQPLHAEELDGVQSEILLTDNTDLHIQEKGQREDRDSGDHFKEQSDLEVLENNHNRLHCFVGSRDRSPGSRSSSPCHDSIFTGLPTRSSYASKHTQRLEAKCRALDTVNQHLQTSLDNTDRKVQRLQAEVQELEAENQSLQATLEELRISARRLEQLETEKQSLEQETTVLEREKRQLEKENRRLRQQAEIQEANLDSSNVCMASLEREMRFLVKEVEGLRETAERVKGLEGDNRELTKQAAIDQRTLATLREELVSEKLKTQQRGNELERLAHELEMKVLNQESTQQAEQEAPDNRFKMLESELESSLKKSLQIKDDKMAALEARLQESSNLNQQLRQELKTVKLSYEALQQRQEEETALTSTPPRETGRAMSEWLRESQEATKELLKLKDRLIEVERNVEKSTLNSQSASLMAQNAQLQQQQSGTESERDSAIREREELRGVHEQLLRDHERLAALHERQAMEFEILMGKHGCLKNAHRTLELEHRTLQDRYNSLLQQRTKLEGLEKALKEEQMRMALEKEQHRTTAAECCRLRDEKDWLNRTYRQLLSDNELLTADHKQLKSQLNEAKLEHTWLEADFSKLKKDFQQLDITSTKLTNQCELLSQLKGNLEEENRHLLSQIETLMLQNRTLLEQTMESKDLFHVEERQYIDKLNDLRRQKEKLEEKIMDQYKFYEPSPPRRRGNWITLKLKKLIKSSSREHGPDRPPTPTHSGAAEPPLFCHDNSSFISSDGSGGSASTSAGDAFSPRRNSSEYDLLQFTRSSPIDLVESVSSKYQWLNGVQSRAQSESSGEFSLSLENEPWSNGSSPVQQPPSRRSSSSYQPPSDTSTPQHTKRQMQHKEKASTMPITSSQNSDIQATTKQKDLVLSQDFWLTRGTKSIRRGSRGKVIRRSSDSGGAVKMNPGLNGINSKPSSSKAETTQASVCSPVTVLYVQGKSSSMSGCLNCFSTPLGKEGRLKGPRSPKSLPRASSVISTAEGSSRRSSVNSDCRVMVKTEPHSIQAPGESNNQEASQKQPEPDANNSESEPIPPVKPPRDPTVVVPTDPKPPVQESLFASSFTFNSVFSNTIFSDSVVTTTTSLDALGNNQTFLCLNASLVQNCPLESQESPLNTPQTLLSLENEKSQNAEHAAGLEERDKPLTTA